MKSTRCCHSLSGEDSNFFLHLLTKKETECFFKATSVCSGGLRRPSDFFIILDMNKNVLAEAAAVFPEPFLPAFHLSYLIFLNINLL